MIFIPTSRRKFICFLIGIIGIFVPKCLSAQKAELIFSVRNQAVNPFDHQIISVPWEEIKNLLPPDTSIITLVNDKGETLIHQFETNGTGKIQQLLVRTVSGKSNSVISVYLIRKKSKPIQPLTYGRFVPERKDDFAWENDRIAFRMYGKALEKTNENAHGIDVWAKRTPNLIIDKWYQSGDYHADHGEGLDYYSVGNTLGAGNCTPIIQDSILYIGNFSQWKIKDNGPLRTTFQLLYDEINVNGLQIKAVKTISLDAGSWLNKISVEFHMNNIDSIQIAAGMVTRKEPGFKLLDEKNGIMLYWEPAHPLHGTIGTGVIFEDGKKTMTEYRQQLIAKTKIKSGVPFTYYSGACWNKQGRFTDETGWKDALYAYQKYLTNPPQVIIHNNVRSDKENK